MVYWWCIHGYLQIVIINREGEANTLYEDAGSDPKRMVGAASQPRANPFRDLEVPPTRTLRSAATQGCVGLQDISPLMGEIKRG